MTLFVDKQKITGKETEQLFSAGISLLLSKAYPAAYSCFNRISDEDFSVPYNKALCCFMVKWHDECYRLLCESEQLMSGRNITREAELPEAFLRYDHAEGHPFHPMPQGQTRSVHLLSCPLPVRVHPRHPSAGSQDSRSPQAAS